MDKFDIHDLARAASDKSRIDQAKKWLKIVQKLYDGSAQAQQELASAQEKLQRAYDESDFYNENEDEISQTRDMQTRMGKHIH